MDTGTLKITKHKDINAVKYYGTIYNRDNKLIKDHIVSKAALDDARTDMINAIQNVKNCRTRYNEQFLSRTL